MTLRHEILAELVAGELDGFTLKQRVRAKRGFWGRFVLAWSWYHTLLAMVDDGTISRRSEPDCPERGGAPRFFYRLPKETQCRTT